jgi:hypothetical protein
MEADIASNVKLGHETQGTNDEVDSSEIRPAPAPTKEDLQNISVDISSSQPLGSTQDGHAEEPLELLDDPIEDSPLDAADTVSAVSMEEMLEAPLDMQENLGNESPAARTLELPPALDLSTSHGE